MSKPTIRESDAVRTGVGADGHCTPIQTEETLSAKEILDIIIIPVTLALIALLWPTIQSWSRRRAFRRLIVRELEEISPHPPEPTLKGWWEHQQKTFVHQAIFNNPSENRNFILSLEPDLVYFVTQLWQAKKEKNWAQWDYGLGCLSAHRWDNNKPVAALRQQWPRLYNALQRLNTPRWDKNGRIATARKRWQCLFDAYQKKVETMQLSPEYDYLAPDGSEIRLLLTMKGGGLAHCTLPPGAVSQAVRHKTVEEIWTFIQGEGQVWRKQDDRAEVVDVKPDVCLTIPAGTHFQFRNMGQEPLCFLIATMPPWPGAEEAVRVEGNWKNE